MRVLFTSFALDAHFLGSVPLAWALRAAGHDVRVASQPALTVTITQAGLSAVPVGDNTSLGGALTAKTGASGASWHSVDFDPGRPEVHTWEFASALHAVLPAELFAGLNDDTMIDDLVRFARYWRPDLVIWEPFTFAGGIAAKAAGAAHARLLWGADLFGDQRTAFLSHLADRPEAEDPMAAWLSPVLDRYGLVFDETSVRGQWTIDQMPASIRLPLGEHTVPMRYVPYNGAAVVPGWLREPPGRPRVCVTVGLTARDGADYLVGSLAGLFDALGDLDVEVIATLNAEQRAQAEPLPPNVRAVDFVPLQALLPTCSAIANHGGAGTWSTAVACGVPQLISPSTWDNFYRARRTAELGAGIVTPRDELTPDALRDGLRRLLDDERFADGADRLRAEMTNEPDPAGVVPALEKLTATHQDLPL
ncbi:activator-dependent family glycosyltransferase [Amycolatopsis suaedae]|uniref:Activator-dependent family glycosyltransferase n=1 Tax=Amycolatopsis suaedae TaxID=2510978 RepID=A0A4Q7J322_9PSEU|nr:activator-dependent family glycosyltransferase [Amycolatopsis suaedae]RZQ61012.1 activator-dependent family glycosyltransferase [Amycolatopsis suaedae]